MFNNNLESKGIAYVRRALGLSLREAATLSGISHEQIRRLEAGVDRPRPETKELILRAYSDMAADKLQVATKIIDEIAAIYHAA